MKIWIRGFLCKNLW